ncbi:MAG TPA: Pycsar system effector family protein, partial [Limnobacter sp.]
LTGVQKFASLQDAPNPMFFGFFTQFSQSEFSDYAASVLQHDQHARALLIRDIYQIGHILRRKYKGLRIAYLLQSVSLVILFGAVLSQFIR